TSSLLVATAALVLSPSQSPVITVENWHLSTLAPSSFFSSAIFWARVCACAGGTDAIKTSDAAARTSRAKWRMAREFDTASGPCEQAGSQDAGLRRGAM